MATSALQSVLNRLVHAAETARVDLFLDGVPLDPGQ